MSTPQQRGVMSETDAFSSAAAGWDIWSVQIIWFCVWVWLFMHGGADRRWEDSEDA